MSTYLEICQQVHRITGMGSRGNTAKPGTVPTSVTGQVDELAEIVEWVKQAYVVVQNEIKWPHLVQAGTLVFGSTVNTVAPRTTLTTYAEMIPFVEGCGLDVRQYALCYLTASGQTAEQQIIYEPYQDFRGFRDRGTVATGRPTYFTVDTDRDVIVYPTPDASYTIRFNYRTEPQVWTSSDGSLDPKNYPVTGKGLPVEFHDAIAWRAVRWWAITRQNPGMLGVAEREYRMKMMRARAMYLPAPRWVP